MGKFKHAIIVSVLILVTSAGLYFLFDWMFTLPEPASSQAVPIDNLFQAHFITMAVLFAMIMVIMIYSVVVFRRRPDDEADGPHVHGHTGLEIAWTIIPTIVVVGFGVYGLILFREVTADQPDEMVVSVTGRQWSWAFEYPEADVRSARLVLPVDQPVLLELHSEDVLHSFWVPEFRVKQDLVPGQTTHVRFTPVEVGEYKLRCAELCGLTHWNMLATVRVVPQDEYDAWMTEQAWRQWVTLGALVVLYPLLGFTGALLALVLMEALFAGLGLWWARGVSPATAVR